MKEKTAENVVQAYLSGVLAHKGGSVAILSDNGTEFKNELLNEAWAQFGINILFSNPFYFTRKCKSWDSHKFSKMSNHWILRMQWSRMLWPFTICMVLL